MNSIPPRRPVPRQGVQPPNDGSRNERNILAAIAFGLFVVVVLIGAVILIQMRSGGRDSGSALTDASLAVGSSATGDSSTTGQSTGDDSLPATSAPSSTAGSDTALSTTPPVTTLPIRPSTIPTTTVPAGSTQYPVLFSINTFVGYWQGDTFTFGQDGLGAPAGLVGSQAQLVNSSGATYNGTVSSCQNEVLLNPAPTNVESAYWHSEAAPFVSTRTNDDRSLDAMNVALTAQGIDPDHVGSYGAPLAADGSVERVMWFPKDAVSVGWVATFDAQTNTITTIDGDPVAGADYELSRPDGEWLDLDRDGNLESHIIRGDTDNLVEWATQSTLWSAGTATCPG